MKLNRLLEEGRPFPTKVKAEMKLKSGTVIPVGTEVSCNFNHSNLLVSCALLEKPLTISYRAAAKYLAKFRPEPSLKALEKMSDDGIATTPIGSRVEPDGTGPYNDPSWMLVIGII